MVDFPRLDEAFRIGRLAPPTGRVRMVLDTDTYNEIDDQFALVYSLLSPERLDVEAIYAAPFYSPYGDRSTDPGDGMEKSYEEILRLLELLGVAHENFAYRGSTRYLGSPDTPAPSAAAEDLVRRAMAGDGSDPLYVVAIGAITNVASAMLMEPRIIERIVVVWLGGEAPWWPHTYVFNLVQDIPSARVVFDSGVPMIHIPCYGVTSHLLTTLPEIERHVQGQGKLGDYLAKIYREYHEDQYAVSKVIWDISALAWLLNPGWVPTVLKHSPIVTDQVTWSVDERRHLIREAYYAHRDPIFRDLFEKLRKQASANQSQSASTGTVLSSNQKVMTNG